MAGTAATIANLLLQFPLPPAAGGFGAQQVQNLIVSAMEGQFVNVVNYGADPTGATDSTSAFSAALAAGRVAVPAFQPGTTTRAVFMVNNLSIPSGAVIAGWDFAGYGGGNLNSDAFMRPRIIGPTTSTRLFNVDGTQGARFEGIMLDGSNASTPNTTDCISGGSRSLTITNCLITGGRFGIGGAVSGSTQSFPSAVWQANIYNCVIQDHLIGLGDFVDCFIFGCSFAFCGNGVLTTSAASSSATSFNGCRFEFCGQTGITPGGAAGYGVHLDTVGVTQFNGCQWDACGNAGIFFDNAFWCSINGGSFIRNGCNTSAGTTLISTSAHISLNDAFDILISGVMTQVSNPGGPNVYCPAAAVNWVGSAFNNGGVNINNSDLSGYQGSTAGASKTGPTNSNTLWKIGNVPTSSGNGGFILSKNFGTGTAAQDVDTR